MSSVSSLNDREFQSAPTLDTERKSLFHYSSDWRPSKITISNHSIDIDIPTGNLIITTTDVGYPFYNLPFFIRRKYDVQEQYMQLLYLKNTPNVDPKPHCFGNWRFAYEANIENIWKKTYFELQVISDVGVNNNFIIEKPDFSRNIIEERIVEDVLHKYGVSYSTLESVNWILEKNDFLLRTRRGQFSIVTGNFKNETLVDDLYSNIWVFNPLKGITFCINSKYFYNIRNKKIRDVGFPLFTTKIIDALGHAVKFKPLRKNEPPYRNYILADDTGRQFQLKMDCELHFNDGFQIEGKVRKFLVKEILDLNTQPINKYKYEYNKNFLLKNVIFPNITDNNKEYTYHYYNREYPGIIKAIENSFGQKIEFEYIKDPLDNDERIL